jgi:hypothetical protein
MKIPSLILDSDGCWCYFSLASSLRLDIVFVAPPFVVLVLLSGPWGCLHIHQNPFFRLGFVF